MIRRCEDCRWWDNSIQRTAIQSRTAGECRLNSPHADERDHSAVWPFTEGSDWCGSFVEKEPDIESDIF